MMMIRKRERPAGQQRLTRGINAAACERVRPKKSAGPLGWIEINRISSSFPAANLSELTLTKIGF